VRPLTSTWQIGADYVVLTQKEAKAADHVDIFELLIPPDPYHSRKQY
jgi:hypothetical protein